MASKLKKGFEMEERLRFYFLQSGYYVVRGVPFNYEGFSVTDIDLWLYSRSSPVTREITIVDIKNKRTPQAIERIFWAKGLSKAVNANSVIVATTDRRKEVKSFGKELDVQILDGTFLSRLPDSSTHLRSRLSDEEFFEVIESYSLGKLDGDWKGRIESSKGALSRGLNFDSCNEWLEQSNFFAKQVLTKPSRVDIALRCFYATLSMFVIGVDYMMKELSFLEHEERVNKLSEGFTYGTKGKDGLAKMLNLSLSLVEQFSEEGSAVSAQARAKIENEFASLPTKILGEFFSKPETGRSLFNVARELENYSMMRNFTPHSEASLETRALIGCFLDYQSINRKEFSSAAGIK